MLGRRIFRRSWFIDSIDTTTRYMVSSEFTKHRDLKEIKQVLKQAKKKIKNQISIVTSDGRVILVLFKRYSQ